MFITETQSECNILQALTFRLTHYLKYILRGNSSIHIIGTINQEDKHIMETLNTLNFISKAKKIDVHPKMNFKTKNENINEKNLTNLIEKIKFLEQEKEVLSNENQNLKVQLDILKNKDIEKNSDKDKIIQKLKLKIELLEKSKIKKNPDLDKTVVVKSKRFNDKKQMRSNNTNEINLNYNHIQPILKMKKRKVHNIESEVYNSSEKDELVFLKKFNKSIDFGK